jgi:hypothetical protein
MKTAVRIGVVGSNARATEMGRLLVDAGHNVSSGDAGSGASVLDMLIFAGPRGGADEIVNRLGKVPDRTVVVDAMEGTVPAGPEGAALLAEKLGIGRVVRAMIAQPKAGSHVLMWGHDHADMQLVADVFRAAGCVTTDCDPTLNAII